MSKGPRVAWWLRHYATSRKVPGSIPGVAGFFSVASDSSVCPGVDSASKKMVSVVVKALRYKSGGPGIDSRFRRVFFRGI
jgi:hypothetical protein